MPGTLVQISFLKKGNLDSKKHFKDPFPNIKAQNLHKWRVWGSDNNMHAPLIWTALSRAEKKLGGTWISKSLKYFKISNDINENISVSPLIWTALIAWGKIFILDISGNNRNPKLPLSFQIVPGFLHYICVPASHYFR